ncbi:MAG: hypothetical protein M3680_01860 [Myxococcota bacterium]|nr:hypothetical protein [Myxococcota bacterium]
MKLHSILLFTLTTLTACATDPTLDPEVEVEEDLDLLDADEPVDMQLEASRMFAGVNGDYCVASPFNCRFREPRISQRVTTAGGEESWGIASGASIRDGHGKVLGVQTGASRLKFNYGQTRALAGKAHALAVRTSNGSAGWYPLDHILGETSFRAQVGEVNAKDPRQGRLGCYAIRNSHDASRELEKVVYDSEATHERAGDYMSRPRINGERSANLVFMVPGFGLGGATTDHFPARTKFRRVDVPTSSGRPSITIPLWVQDGSGRYRQQSGTMRFLYGYVVGAGVKRFGWMAEDALVVSSGCP